MLQFLTGKAHSLYNRAKDATAACQAAQPRRAYRALVGCVVLLLTMAACSPTDLFIPPTPTPASTRLPAPTFTPTPDTILGLIVVTPPNAGTPGVIIVPPGVDPSTLIPLPAATNTPTPTETVPQPTTDLAVPATALVTMSPTDAPTATSELATTESPSMESPSTEDVGSQPLDDAVTDNPSNGVPAPLVPPADITTPVPGAAGSAPLLPTPTVDRSRIVVLVPGPTPAPPAAAPTETPTPLPTPTPSATPTPFVLVEGGLVSLRSGPGVEYPLVAQLGPNLPIAIVGRNPEGTWLQICCVNAQSLWVAANHVAIQNPVQEVALVLPDVPPPPATATPTPTDTPTVTPTPTATPHAFAVADGPQYFPTNNPFLSVWVKVYAGSPEDPQPLPGYFLKVEFRARPEGSAWDSRPNTRGEAPSNDYFEYSAPAGPAGGNRVQFNYKYEFLPPDPQAENPNSSETRLTLIDGFWRIYLTDGSGTQLSDYIQFDTLGGNPNREVFVAWTPR